MAERFWRLVFRRQRAHPYETFEESQPWLVYSYFVPGWVVRILGRGCIRLECSICGVVEWPTLRIPRWGPITDRGRHPARVRFMADHEHPGVRNNALSWERPLRNPSALREGDIEDVMEVAVHRARRAAPEGTGGNEP
jgi:hypothetical protein